ncbi:MAG: DNA polymerase III subunit delta [Gammaproteobacteria bacterium]|nr:DNA polymerase III subunit delta [Gammaproteobacteria bacterium]
MLELLPWQTSQWQLLAAAISQNKLHHALLLTGPDGIGLGHFANVLAARLLCHQAGADFMCGNCKSCLLFNAGNHPDLMLLEPEETGKQIKVDLVRELIAFMQQTNQYGRKKIAIFDPAEAMNRSSANSLLKTLEEPPADTLIMLISHQPGLLPVTIRSRCQRLIFHPSYSATTISWLWQNAGTNDIDMAELLEIAQGAPLKALQLLEQDPIGKRQSLLQDLIDIRRTNVNVVKIAEKWLSFDAEQVLLWLMSFFQQMTHLKLAPGNPQTGNSSGLPYLQELANELDLAGLVACYDEAAQHYQALMGPFNLNEQGVLENMIIHWQTTGKHS